MAGLKRMGGEAGSTAAPRSHICSSIRKGSTGAAYENADTGSRTAFERAGVSASRWDGLNDAQRDRVVNAWAQDYVAANANEILQRPDRPLGVDQDEVVGLARICLRRTRPSRV
jgi:hypothetical protein